MTSSITHHLIQDWNEWKPEGFSKGGYKVYLSREAMTEYVNAKPGYEKTMLGKGITALLSMPFPTDGREHFFYPTTYKKKRDPGIAGVYEISYTARPGILRVTSISYDMSLFGSKDPKGNEVSALYKIRKNNKSLRFNESIRDRNQLERLTATWSDATDESVERDISTKYAAVNGMDNDLEKAQWLMGTHLEWAYRSNADNINEYTLFHNQSVGTLSDLYECVADKQGTTENAKYLASVLADVQRRGQPVQWVAHSQGGIIFTSAVEYFNDHPNLFNVDSLSKNSVVFHSSGKRIDNNGKREGSSSVLARAGIRAEFPMNNPFDLVPSLAGGNDRSLSTLATVIPFIKRVCGDNPLCSPHTLPFITLQHYHDLLVANGDERGANRVKRSKYYQQEQEKLGNKAV